MLNTGKAFTYFQNVWLCKKATKGWYSFDCPFCGGSQKRAVNFHYEITKCWKCGSDHKYTIIDFITGVTGKAYRDAKEYLNTFDESQVNLQLMSEVKVTQTSAVKMPLGYHSILDGDTSLAVRARTYLEGRGFDLVALDQMGVGYSNLVHEDYKQDYFGRVIVPFKDNGLLTYFEGRSFIGDTPKYKNPEAESLGVGKSELIFNEEALYLHEEVYINEGTFDSMTLVNASALKGKVLSYKQKSKIINGTAEIINVCLDPEAMKEAYKMAMELVEYKNVRVIALPPGEKDANDLGREFVEEIKNNTPFETMGSLVSKIMDL